MADGTLESCTLCRNFTVREALEYTFNGNLKLVINSDTNETNKNCSQYTFQVKFDGLESFFFNSSFVPEYIGCMHTLDLSGFDIPHSKYLDSPALMIPDDHLF